MNGHKPGPKPFWTKSKFKICRRHNGEFHLHPDNNFIDPHAFLSLYTDHHPWFPHSSAEMRPSCPVAGTRQNKPLTEICSGYFGKLQGFREVNGTRLFGVGQCTSNPPLPPQLPGILKSMQSK